MAFWVTPAHLQLLLPCIRLHVYVAVCPPTLLLLVLLRKLHVRLAFQRSSRRRCMRPLLLRPGFGAAGRARSALPEGISCCGGLLLLRSGSAHPIHMTTGRGRHQPT